MTTAQQLTSPKPGATGLRKCYGEVRDIEVTVRRG
jgi:hypothetical protein